MVVHGQYDEPQGQHPEAQDGQEAQKASGTEYSTQNGTLRFRSGNTHAELAELHTLTFSHSENRRCLEQEFDIGTPPRTR
jgi:hypothetical protein